VTVAGAAFGILAQKLWFERLEGSSE